MTAAHRHAALLFCALLCAASAAACDDDTSPSEADAGLDTSSDASVDGNRPPTLKKIGDRRAPIGQPLRIALEGDDPDGDPLSFSVFGELPEGSKFVKESRTFEWTPKPEDDGRLILLTFAVSDGRLDDRETVQLTVTTSAEATRPVLAEIGDVFLEVGQPYTLQLEATDEDGDTLSYSNSGPLPSGASLDGKTGRFSWTPAANQQDSAFRVIFVVSDGSFRDDVEARFIVQSAELTFEDIPPQEVALGDTLTLPLPISNPLDYPFTCSVVGALPDGANFDATGCVFRWTPTEPALADTSREIVFQVQETGERDYTQLRSTSVTVLPASTDCVADAFAPNGDAERAAALEPGLYEGLTICGDEDWFDIEVPAGDGLEILVTFTHGSGGDLDAALFDPEGELVGLGDSTTDDEAIILPPTEAGGVYRLRIFEFSSGQNTYDLELRVGAPSCQNDADEPNDLFEDATPLGDAPGHDIEARICPREEDWFSFDALRGERLDVTLIFDNAEGDLDLTLYDPTGDLVAFSATTSDIEEIAIAALPEGGAYHVLVNGYQSASADYLMEILRSEGLPCAADVLEGLEGNNAPELAAPLQPDASASELTWCGDADYYRVTLPAETPLQVTLTWGEAGDRAQMHLVDVDTLDTLTSAIPLDDGSGMRLSWPGEAQPRDVLIEVVDATLGLRYDLTLVTTPCDAGSCPTSQVCGAAGACVPDGCAEDAECPEGFACRAGLCAEPCEDSSGCRQDYSCRALTLDDPQPRCAPDGDSVTASACASAGDCAGPRTCLQGDRFPGGACARIGCASDEDCDIDSTCVDLGDASGCLAFCFEDSDCAREGYACVALTSVGTDGSAEVCVAP